MSATNAHETTPAPPQSASPANSASPGLESKQTQGGLPEEKKATTTTPQPEDEMRALLQNMAQAAMTLGAGDASLQSRIVTLNITANAPGQTQEESFRRDVAYALQDLERTTGRTFLAAGSLATELHERATTLPGLQNPSIGAFLAATPTLNDPVLVQDIRRTAESVRGMGSEQTTPAVRSVVEVMANRVRLAQAPRVDGAPPLQQAAGGPDTLERQASHAAAPAESSHNIPPRQGGSAMPQGTNGGAPQHAAIAGAGRHDRPSAVMDIVRRLRAPVPTGAEAVMPLPASPIGGRIAMFEERLARGKTDRLIMDADKSGVRAIETAEQFFQGPGRGVLGKIEAAASTEPGGMQQVMKEMQPGGRYANLRTEFDNAYQQDQIFKGAYDKMADSATKFGRDREAVNANFVQRNLDPAQLDGRFQRAEESLGEAMSKVPGKEPGKSALDEMAEKVAEILRTAVDRIKQIFRPEAGAEAQPQARPGPSMSM
jgi:hypothetical protein